ncbi:MAG: methylenetetrahydrofolate reductase [NAD(P)H] [Nocardioidaceae bacterium]
MALGLPSRLPRDAPLRDVLARGDRTFSFEFFPPRDDDGERQLWNAIRRLEGLSPTFVSVTYGAGGTTRDRTVRVTERIATDTTLRPVGHLTCVGHSRAELRSIIGQYAGAGVRTVMALRGDPPGGPGQPWVRHAEGLDHAVELVEMLHELGDFSVGVAAFPQVHPEAVDADADAQVLADKARAGADFAATQMFFRPGDYVDLVDRAARHGCEIPIVPGIMPITSWAQLNRFAQLSGDAVPPEVVARLEPWRDDKQALRAEGIVIATELCDAVLTAGAPGLHFYTLNRSNASREIYQNLAVGVG